jgi:predicted TIM-barrel fold metal-dependent hydrolase
VIGEDRIVWASDYPHLEATFPAWCASSRSIC